MSTKQPTIRLEAVEGYNAVKLTLQHDIDETELHPIGQALTTYLDNTTKPLYIVVDLLSEPNLPIGPTTYEVLAGPGRHPNLGKWLLVGSSPSARLIKDFVTLEINEDNSLWFKSEAEAMIYLDGLTSGRGGSA